jgi:inhibitor of KinA sporulation pathway (predicted exonuclease)
VKTGIELTGEFTDLEKLYLEEIGIRWTRYADELPSRANEYEHFCKWLRQRHPELQAHEWCIWGYARAN